MSLVPVCVKPGYFFPESFQFKLKVFSASCHFVLQFSHNLKIVRQSLRCSDRKPVAMQNPCIEFFRVGHDRTSPVVINALDWKSQHAFPTLNRTHAIS